MKFVEKEKFGNPGGISSYWRCYIELDEGIRLIEVGRSPDREPDEISTWNASHLTWGGVITKVWNLSQEEPAVLLEKICDIPLIYVGRGKTKKAIEILAALEYKAGESKDFPGYITIGFGDEIILVNQELPRFTWSWAWLRYDANNSCEPVTEFHNEADLQATLDELPFSRTPAVCEFYICPLCGGETNSPLGHLLNHTGYTRIWQTGKGTWHIKLSGETEWNKPHRINESFPQYATSGLLAVVQAARAMFDTPKGGIAAVKKAVKEYEASLSNDADAFCPD